MTPPEPCLSGRCWSPIACNGWGYCRERNALTDEESARDCRESYEAAVQAMRQRALAEGRIPVPRPEETLDLVLLAGLP